MRDRPPVLRAAIDDAMFAVAERFNLNYRVLHSRFGMDGAEYRIGLEVKPRTPKPRTRKSRGRRAKTAPSVLDGKLLVWDRRLPDTAAEAGDQEHHSFGRPLAVDVRELGTRSS